MSAVIRSNSRRLGTEAQRSEVRAPLESPLRIASLCAPSLLVQALVVQLLVVVHLRPEASGVSPARRDEPSSGKGPPRGRHAPSGTGADRCACPAQTPLCWQTPSPAGRSPSAVKPTRTKRSANLAAARAHGVAGGAAHDHGHLLKQQPVLPLNLHVPLCRERGPCQSGAAPRAVAAATGNRGGAGAAHRPPAAPSSGSGTGAYSASGVCCLRGAGIGA